MTQPALTVGIVTRDRTAALLRNLLSIRLLGSLVREILILDDSPDARAETVVRAQLPADGAPLRFLPDADNPGPVVARNRLVDAASTEAVLLLDDDAAILDDEPVRTALDILHRDASIAVIAFAQAESDGSSWPAAMQPALATFPCEVASHIGFAHLVRRSVFLELGGYRGALYFYGEEKEFALRVLDSGRRVVYLPHCRVAHLPDPAGRSGSRVLRYTVRNNCLLSLYNHPLPLALTLVPLRLLQYFSMRRGWQIHDPGGLRWIGRELVALLPSILRDRRPVRWRTVIRWRALQRTPRPYRSPGRAA